MKRMILIMAFLMLLWTAASGQIDIYTDTDYLNPLTPGTPYMTPASPNVTYSTTTTGGAPIPVAPSSAESQGIAIPSDVTSTQTPPVQEQTDTVMRSTQEAAYAYAPTGGQAMTTYQATNRMIVPPYSIAPNKLYISYAPRTVASCNLYANLPLWMSTSGTGSIWFYEWYPSGWLDTQYAGYAGYPGWYKRWFFADTPGWHILQYYCGGWSNYAYIYVNGYNPYWVNPSPSPSPSPSPYPYWGSQITYTDPFSGHTYYRYQWSASTSTQN